MDNTTVEQNLAQQWDELKAQNPKLRIRNAAEELGVSEAQLLATRIGDGVARLKPEFRNILLDVEKLGKVMALTRNNSVVHERKGVYQNPTINPGPVGLFVGADIDLRVFWHSWKYAYAVTEMARGKERHSLQFFSSFGEAIHKIYLVNNESYEPYLALVKKYIDENQESHEEVTDKKPAYPEELHDDQIDTHSFQEGWLNLKDTHDFFGLVQKHKLSRTQALRLAPEGNYAVKVDNQSLRTIVTTAAEQQVPIMVFVGNPGMIQIHTGEVKKLLDHEGWFNIMDPDFNLHVKEADITESWVVRKPSVDGIVTALECFDASGNQIVQLFGKRKPGIPELESWRSIVQEAESVHAK